jgi:hypothetical protein
MKKSTPRRILSLGDWVDLQYIAFLWIDLLQISLSFAGGSEHWECEDRQSFLVSDGLSLSLSLHLGTRLRQLAKK